MSNKKKDINDKLEQQLNEDRELIMEAYQDLRSMLGSPQDFAVNGSTLAKLAELLMKQTGQVLELSKIKSKKDKDDNDELNENDLEKISEEIKKAKKWA
jgi:hypothetical protein